MRQRIPLEIALPDFGDRVNFVERNRRFQAYRRWGYDQRNKGAPVTCWCLYIWIKGNNIADRNLRCDVIRVTKRPPGATSNQWQNWRNHHRTGGLLSFPEYLARYNANAKKGQGYRQDLVGVPLGKRQWRRPARGGMLQRGARLKGRWDRLQRTCVAHAVRRPIWHATLADPPTRHAGPPPHPYRVRAPPGVSRRAHVDPLA